MTTRILLTKTHIITVRKTDWFLDVPVFIQAFIPDSATPRDSNGIGTLRLTHEVTIRIAPHSFSLLRNSVVDPISGSVTIKLLHISPSIQTGIEPKHMSCLNLTLPKPPSTADILPISVRSQRLFEYVWSAARYTASDDGYVRGLLLMCSPAPQRRAVSACKFTIDARAEECTMTCGDPCPINLPGHDVVFDGVRGRIHCCQHENVSDPYLHVVTVDLA